MTLTDALLALVIVVFGVYVIDKLADIGKWHD